MKDRKQKKNQMSFYKNGSKKYSVYILDTKQYWSILVFGIY